MCLYRAFLGDAPCRTVSNPPSSPISGQVGHATFCQPVLGRPFPDHSRTRPRHVAACRAVHACFRTRAGIFGGSLVLGILYFAFGSVDLSQVEGVVHAVDGHSDRSGVDSGGHRVLGEGRQQHVLPPLRLGHPVDVAAHLLGELLLGTADRLADLGDVSHSQESLKGNAGKLSL